MKNLIAIRHGKKDGENIAASQLAEIEANGVPMVNELVKGQNIVLHQGTGLDRTRQTIAAFSRYLKQHPENGSLVAEWLQADPRFGNQTMFDKFMSNPKIVEDFKTSNWLTAFEKHNPTFIIEVQSEMFTALRETFSLVPDGTTIVTVGHTPLLEWLAFRIDKREQISRDIQLKELEGFIFTEEQRQITITGTIGL